jgi:signal transduction histidine kinase
LTALLVVMVALFFDARSRESEARLRDETTQRMMVDWASRVSPQDLPRLLPEFDFVVDAAILHASNKFSILKGGRGLTRERVAALANLAKQQDRRVTGDEVSDGVSPERGDPHMEFVIPVFLNREYDRAYYFRISEGAPSAYGPLRIVYLVLLLSTFVGIAVTVFALNRWVLRPLAAVSRGAARVARGDLSTAVAVRAGPRDEIRSVAASFNEMMEELRAFREGMEDEVGRSIRQRREAEKNLATAQRLAAMGTLAAGIAHDINNPLGGMINAVRALERGDLSEEKRAEYLALIEDGLDRVAHTVQKVLQFSPHQVAPQACDLVSIADRALALGRHRIERAKAEVEMEMPEDGLPVFGDPYELQQVLLNLLVNAADAVAGTDRGRRVLLQGHRGHDEVLLSVKDTGIGMDEEQAAKAFDLFFTTKEVGEGSGLGLAIVHTILQNHGGRVEMRSKVNEGTTVEVSLPLYRQG